MITPSPLFFSSHLNNVQQKPPSIFLIGAAALGGGAYAAGLFDPKPAPDPKYPGYNRFYAADPEMIQPFSRKEIDYSRYLFRKQSKIN